MFELYVYFNFSGISFMVYGLLTLAGLPVILNFQAPFSARHVPEFWQRWHITLSTWIRDYLYVRLGGRDPIGADEASEAIVSVSTLVNGLEALLTDDVGLPLPPGMTLPF